ncbi:hypothetical protein PYV02_03445 [Leifsonia sp. H3M29-4]|uniref:hypothetical protein n=1 Tax=Salinibacterium metalliresistens TaxID=3031321 RepID=UPI0023D9B6B0|nr:hypothetical protein [Salinibacterium metalliresistens]MDF1478130.1 hypothetical protein [Salinibacterium metalliresistens]
MTKSRPAGGSRTLVGLLSTFALVGGVVGFQNAATAQETATDVAPRGVGTSDAPAAEVPPEAVPAPAPVVEAPAVEAPVVEAPAPAPAPAPVVEPQPAPAPAQPSGTTGGSGG